MREIRGLTGFKDLEGYKVPKKYTEEEINATMEKARNVPDIPEDVLGEPYEGKCTCGGTITAIRSPFNGHIAAKCDLCGFLLFE